MSIPEQFIRSPHEVNGFGDITVERMAVYMDTDAIFKGISISFTDRNTVRTEPIPNGIYFSKAITEREKDIEVGKTVTSEVPIKIIYKDNVTYELQQIIVLVNCENNGSPSEHFAIDFTSKTKL